MIFNVINVEDHEYVREEKYQPTKPLTQPIRALGSETTV